MANTAYRNNARHRAGRGGARLGIAVSLVTAVGACSSVPDAVNPVEWYKSAEHAVFGGTAADTETTSPETTASTYRPPEIPARDQPFPNLGEGPERPVVRSPAETAQLTEGLVADRARARHSDLSIPLQGMSGERRMALPMASEGAPVVASTTAPEVIRTQLGPAAAATAEGGAQRPVNSRRPTVGAERAEGPTASAPAQGSRPAAVAGAQGTRSQGRVVFSDAPPPPSASPAPPPRPQFSNAPPATLGLSSVPSQTQPRLATPDSAPATATALPPPPPLRSAAVGGGAASIPASGVDAPENSSAEEIQNRPAEENMAALDQRPGSAARSELIATIQFSGNATEFGDSERNILRQVAALHQQRGGMIRVMSHGGDGRGGDDSAQDAAENDQIALERASLVARELMRLGVRREEIRAVAVAGSAAPEDSVGQATEIYFVY